MNLLRLIQEGQMSAVKSAQVFTGVIFDAQFVGAVSRSKVFAHLTVRMEGCFI